jgi:C4-dicarboxylate-specific signal transduction histidine kinase
MGMSTELTVTLRKASSANGHAGETVFATIRTADRAAFIRSLKTAGGSGNAVLMEMRVVGRGGGISLAGRPPGVKPAADLGGDEAANGRATAAQSSAQNSPQASDERYQLMHLARVAMSGELSGALAHELQQPLTAIVCNAQSAEYLLAKERVDVVELAEILADISREGKHAGEIIRRLRALLMRGETQFQRVVLAELFGDVLAIVRATLTERNVQLHMQSDEMVAAVRGDRVELQQVVLNLVLNACESMSGNGRYDRRIDVLASLDSASRTVRISVMDCGRGIAPDLLERIFEPFVSTKEAGLGLGLSICRSIVVAHGGRMWATNRPERGAAFHFTVPLSEREDPL